MREPNLVTKEKPRFRDRAATPALLLVGIIIGAGGVVYWKLAPPKGIAPTDAAGYWTMIAGTGAALGALFTGGAVLVARAGLESLGLTKVDMRLRGQRESRACAIERCREFADEILARNIPLRGRLPVFVKDAKEVVFNTDGERARLQAARDWASALPMDVHVECSNILNRMEAWAMYFTQQLASEKVAYGPVGLTFLSLDVQFYGLLVFYRQQPGSGQFPNLVELFEAWFVTKNEKEMADNLEKVEAALRDLRAAKARAPKSGLKPTLEEES